MADPAAASGGRGENPVHGSLGKILDAMPDGILVCDTRGTIVYANDRLAALTGYARDNLVGREIELLVPESLRSSHGAHRARYVAQGLPTRDMGTELQIRLRRRSGDELRVDIALAPMVVEETTYIVAAVRDATARLRAEAMAAETERRQRVLLENVPLLVVGMSIEARIEYVNPHFVEVTGYTLDELRGKDPFQIFLSDAERDVARDDFSLVEAGQVLERYEVPIRTKSGPVRIVSWYSTLLNDPNGDPVGTLSIGEDVTEARQQSRRLEAVNEFARQVLSGESTTVALGHVARSARELVGADFAYVATVEGDTLSIVAVDGEGRGVVPGYAFAVEGSVAGAVVRDRQPKVLANAASVTAPTAPLATARIGPAILVPLGEDSVRGVLAVGNLQGRSGFGAPDLAAVGLLASQAEVLLEYGRMQEETRLLAVVQDRERIARDLHDGAIQSLFGIGLRLQALTRRAADEDRLWLEESVDSLNVAIRDIRAYIHELRTDVLTRSTVTSALHRLALEFQGRTGVRTSIDIQESVVESLEPSGHDVLHFVSEALSNVGKHADARSARIRIGSDQSGVVIEVADDGSGFDPSAVSDGFGVPNLRSRAAALGGRLHLDSAPGRGTTVAVRIPGQRAPSASP